MRKYLLIVLILIFAPCCRASIALVNTTSGEAAGSASTIAATAANHTTGNLLVVLIRVNSNSDLIDSVNDTAGNTYAQCTSASSSTNALTDIWYAKNITGNASNVVTANIHSATTFRAIIVHQYSGADTTSPFEVAQHAAATGTSVTSASFSPASSGNVNVAIGSQTVSGTNNWSAGTNYTLQVNSGGNANCESEDRLSAPSGAQTATINFSTSSGMDISVASFKPAAGAATSGSQIIGPSKVLGPSKVGI